MSVLGILYEQQSLTTSVPAVNVLLVNAEMFVLQCVCV